MKMKFMIRIVVCVIFLHQHVTLMAHSHHRGMPRRSTTQHHAPVDVFVRPVSEATTSGRYHPAKRPDADLQGWVPIGEGRPQHPCGGKTIHRVQRENITHAGTDSLTLEIQVRRETNRIRVQSVQKVLLPSSTPHYVISSSVGVAFYQSTADDEENADKKTSHCVDKPKPKPKRKMKAPHNSRKPTAASRDAKGSPHRHKLKRHGDCRARFPRSLSSHSE